MRLHGLNPVYCALFFRFMLFSGRYSRKPYAIIDCFLGCRIWICAWSATGLAVIVRLQQSTIAYCLTHFLSLDWLISQF